MSKRNWMDHKNTRKERGVTIAAPDAAPEPATDLPRRVARRRAGARVADAHGWRATFLTL